MIKQKLKECSQCKQQKFLFSRGLCKDCWNKEYAKPIKNNKKEIKKVSNSRKERLKKYEELKKEYFALHSVCEFPNCTSTEIELHHKSGRIGDNLFKDFCSLCHKHHQWCELNPLEAKELGLSLSRLK